MSASPRYKPLTIYGAVATDTSDPKPFKDQEGKTAVTTTSGWDGSGNDGGANHYVEIPCEDSTVVAVYLRWYDSTISINGTGEVHVTNLPHEQAAVDSEVVGDWYEDTSVTFTGPAASATRSEMLNISAVGCRRMRLKLPITANGDLSVHCWAKD
jgi:hypothetical protein